MEQHISLTEAEWRVMEELWAAGPLTGRAVAQRMKERCGWSRSTTLTMLHRLEEKGAVRGAAEGKEPKVFSPLLGREDAALQETTH